MEYLIIIGTAIGVFAWGVFGNMLSNDLYDRCPKWAEFLIKRATRRLDYTERDRFFEEWIAHLHECDGNLSKILHAAGCWVVVYKRTATKLFSYVRDRLGQAIYELGITLYTMGLELIYIELIRLQRENLDNLKESDIRLLKEACERYSSKMHERDMNKPPKWHENAIGRSPHMANRFPLEDQCTEIKIRQLELVRLEKRNAELAKKISDRLCSELKKKI